MTFIARLFGLQTNWEALFDFFPEFDRVEDQVQSQDTRDGTTKHAQTFSVSDNVAKDIITANQDRIHVTIVIHIPKVTIKVPGEARANDPGVTGDVRLDANRNITTNQSLKHIPSPCGGGTI